MIKIFLSIFFLSRSQNIICQSDGGSANNWAFGYNVKGSTYGNLTLEAVRRELEKTDQLEGILLLLSAAGGTGSGVGSRTVHLYNWHVNFN